MSIKIGNGVTSILVGEHQGFIHIEVSANAFLYYVRNIVGALKLVGSLRPPEWMIASGKRSSSANGACAWTLS